MPVMAQSSCLAVPTSMVMFNEPESAVQVNGTRFVPSNGTILVPVNPSAATAPTLYVGTASTATTTNIVPANTAGTWLRSVFYLTSGTASTTQSTICINGANYFIYNTDQAVNVQAFQACKPWIKPPTEKKTKSSIKRALKLMMNVGFEEEARIFLKGDTVEVSHPESLLKFVIKKESYHSIIDRTVRPGYSTPYSLSLYTKSDIHVANLCVYMENTPMLDQVLAVAMFIKSGSEEMILKQANWSRLNNDRALRDILALEYPYLSRKLQSHY